MRASGILLSVSSLPSPYGIGCFSKEAYSFIDKLKAAGQKYWQILPLGITGYGDSPYQSFSTFAGNPYFIDPEALYAKGWIKKEDLCDCIYQGEQNCVDYGWLYEHRYKLLRKAFAASDIASDTAFRDFCQKESFWLEDYTLYMALKEERNSCSWESWEEELRRREPSLLECKKKELADAILFHKFLQFEFFTEWAMLKQYANRQGISIIGDIPIYVSYDSADAWSGKELFHFDSKGYPLAVAGVPPDGFSADGQVWGNPLYNWSYHEKTGFDWWIKRLSFCCELYDVVRIDHFRGFDEYFSVPFGDSSAKNGHWEKGPGMKLFHKVKEVFPDRQIIAEDLGYVTDTVRKLVEDSGYAGMKVLEFAFDSRDSGSAADYLPHNYGKNSVVYTGTHDNETVVGWFTTGLLDEERTMVRRYFNDFTSPADRIHKTMIRAVMMSVSNLCVIPMQDILGLGNEARMNQPSTSGKNWRFRLLPGQFNEAYIKELADLTATYGR